MSTFLPFSVLSAVKAMANITCLQNKKNTNLMLLLDSDDLCYWPGNLLLGVILDYIAIVLCILKILHRKLIFSSSNVDNISWSLWIMFMTFKEVLHAGFKYAFLIYFFVAVTDSTCYSVAKYKLFSTWHAIASYLLNMQEKKQDISMCTLCKLPLKVYFSCCFIYFLYQKSQY